MSLIDPPALKTEREEVNNDPREEIEFKVGASVPSEDETQEHATSPYESEVERAVGAQSVAGGEDADEGEIDFQEDEDRASSVLSTSSKKEKENVRRRRSARNIKKMKSLPIKVKDQPNPVQKARKDGYASIPLNTELKTARACLICSLIKAEAEFADEGCDNCERSFKLARERIPYADYTTTNFYGTIAMIKPVDSWVAKWQRLRNSKPGVYAVKVIGEIAPDVKEMINDSGRGRI